MYIRMYVCVYVCTYMYKYVYMYVCSHVHQKYWHSSTIPRPYQYQQSSFHTGRQGRGAGVRSREACPWQEKGTGQSQEWPSRYSIPSDNRQTSESSRTSKWEIIVTVIPFTTPHPPPSPLLPLHQQHICTQHTHDYFGPAQNPATPLSPTTPLSSQFWPTTPTKAQGQDTPRVPPPSVGMVTVTRQSGRAMPYHSILYIYVFFFVFFFFL